MFSEFKDMPIGLGMALIQNQNAMTKYARLSNAKKQQIKQSVQNFADGEQAKERIEEIINQLSN